MHDSRSALLAFALVVAGCFGEPPPGEGGETDSGPSEGSSAPTNTDATDVSATSDPDTTVGSMDASGDESSSGVPCDPSECPEPGEELWTVVLGGEGNDGAYTVLVDAGSVIVGGERTEGPASVPWMASLSLDDGDEEWSNGDNQGEGLSVIRGLVAVGNGRVAGVGSINDTGTSAASWFEVRDGTGLSIASHSYDAITLAFLIGGVVSNSTLWTVGTASDSYDPLQPIPVLLSYRAVEPNPWTIDVNSIETGSLAELPGALFDVAIAPDGQIVAVGYREEATQDAAIFLFTADGEFVEHTPALGGEFADGFVGVAIDDGGSGIAIGNDGTGNSTNQALVVSFMVGASVIEVGEPKTWSGAPFTFVNGFAREGDTIWFAMGMSDNPSDGPGYDAAIARWDLAESAPAWVVPFAADSPGRDYGSDVALAPEGTIVACGVMTPVGSEQGNAWVRRLGR